MGDKDKGILTLGGNDSYSGGTTNIGGGMPETQKQTQFGSNATGRGEDLKRRSMDKLSENKAQKSSDAAFDSTVDSIAAVQEKAKNEAPSQQSGQSGGGEKYSSDLSIDFTSADFKKLSPLKQHVETWKPSRLCPIPRG